MHSRSRIFRRVVVIGRVFALIAAAVPAAVCEEHRTTWTASLGLTTAYDDNVFLQESGPLGERGSWVTTISPKVGVQAGSGASYSVALTYAPDLVLFHQQSGEDHAYHRFSGAMSGRASDVTWDHTFGVTWIDGSGRNLVFVGPGGAPAAGGIPIRERRDALVLRDALKVTVPAGVLFLRPNATYYRHDFQSHQSIEPGYQNYADRSELVLGIDAGRRLNDRGAVVLGYRSGRQRQETLLGTGTAFGNRFDQLLAGFEGQLASKLKAEIMVGPDWRRFDASVPTSFDRDQVLWSTSANVAFSPSARDQLSGSIKRFGQPGFGGRSFYADTTYTLSWRRQLTSETVLTVTGRAYNTDFSRCTTRDDWIYSGAITATREWSKTLTIECAFTYEHAESEVPGTSGREFNHSVISVQFRRVLR